MNAPRTFLIISRSFLLRMRNVSDESCRRNQNTHFVFICLFYLFIYFFENRTFYEIMLNNTAELGRPRVTI